MIDQLDAKLLQLLHNEPRIGVLEASRRLAVARGTVQARLDRMRERGVIRDFGPNLDPAQLGYPVSAFITLEIRQQNGHKPVTAGLGDIPEVLEVHTVTGAGDLQCRVVARSDADLQRVIDSIVTLDGVQRTHTVIALAEEIPYRSIPLAKQAANGNQDLGRLFTRALDTSRFSKKPLD